MRKEVLFKAVWYEGEKGQETQGELLLMIPRVRWTAYQMRPFFWEEVIKTFEHYPPDRGGRKEFERVLEVAKTVKKALLYVEQWWKETDEMEEEEQESS